MADEFDENGNPIDAQAPGDGSPKALRDAYEKQKAQNAALEKQVQELMAKDRKREIEDALSEKGINAKVAKFIPVDMPLEDWLQENGELFGVSAASTDGETKVATQEAAPAPAVPHPLQNQFAASAAAAEGAKAPAGNVDLAKAQETLREGGLEAFEEYIRSQPQR